MPGSPDIPIPSASPSPAALACFGRPPLIPGEQAAAYEALQAGISDNVRPRGVLEEAWVREVGDLTWERLRLRRLKASLMTACAGQGLQRLLESLNISGYPATTASTCRGAGPRASLRRSRGSTPSSTPLGSAWTT